MNLFKLVKKLRASTLVISFHLVRLKKWAHARYVAFFCITYKNLKDVTENFDLASHRNINAISEYDVQNLSPRASSTISEQVFFITVYQTAD